MAMRSIFLVSWVNHSLLLSGYHSVPINHSQMLLCTTLLAFPLQCELALQMITCISLTASQMSSLTPHMREIASSSLSCLFYCSLLRGRGICYLMLNASVFTYSLYLLLECKLCRLETLAFVDRVWQVADSQYVVETVQINKFKDREKETNTTVLPW